MEKIKKIVGVVPFLIFVTVFFLYGLYYVFMTSVGYNRVLQKSEFTLDFYKEVLSSKEFLESLKYTVKINFISAIIAFILTIVIIYLIFLSRRKGYCYSKSFQKIIEAPVFIPYLVGSYGILLLLMKGGLLNKILIEMKILEFPILTNDVNGIGIIVTYVWKALPFMTMMTLPIVLRVDKKWDVLGKIYNLNDYNFFKKIVLPLILPALSASFFIVIAYLFASFETPYILGVTHPSVLAVTVFNMYAKGNLDLRGKIMVINIVISLISLLCGLAVYLTLKYFSKFKDREW